MRTRTVLTILIAAIGLATGALLVRADLQGFSTRGKPSPPERLIARTARRWAAPRAMRDTGNPVPFSVDVWAESRAHFADHCASCHANDGSGDTPMGRAMYPRTPDMRAAATQSLTDGELFSIIEHGIRLTGMPGWGNGTPESERESWGLVHFIRRLPRLTPDEIERMEALNPKTPAQWKEEEDARRFLQGDSTPESPKKGHRD